MYNIINCSGKIRLIYLSINQLDIRIPFKSTFLHLNDNKHEEE